ncbi:hypothetical protein O7627_28800 [Solwaraspora sp. WMMD1047]|uniref:hypothetical protein n=1 Tax=Solwaraspora sp. WMMD1047 TaxID=3016102 RepID=UPI0024167F83|nr:hypothetical protein [Solwaraspora sp. WMMD1047]MDG4833275.1 hypothetical protein [Solwaraspora sp. WMMD1047]
MRKFRIAAATLLTCLALAGCGARDAGQEPDEPGGTVTSPAEPTNPSVPGVPTAPGDPPVVPPTAGPGKSLTPGPPGAVRPSGTITISGTIVAGVEVGCLLLNDYLLVGGDKTLLRSGARVTVTGELQPDLMTTCQQGTPLLVRSARPA